MEISKEMKGYDGVFATRFRKMIEARNCTQKYVAETTNSKGQTISQYFNGDVLPNAEKLRDIAQCLGVSADYLLGLSDVTSSNIDDKVINQLLGLSENTIDKLKSDMTMLYKVTKKTTPQEALSVYNQFINFIREGHRIKEIKAFSESLGISEEEDEEGNYSGHLLLMGEYLLCEVINELVEDENHSDDVFSIARSLDALFKYHSFSELFKVKELVNTIVDGEECLTESKYSFLINDSDVFHIYLLRLQEALIKRKNRIVASDSKD